MVLDADYCFAMMHGIIGLLADHDELAPVILVGIAYPGVAEQKQGPIYKRSRTRDYTPSHVENDGFGYGEEFQKVSGGGDHFLDFIAQELTPYLEREFRVRPQDRTIVGYSFGGLRASDSPRPVPTLPDREPVPLVGPAPHPSTREGEGAVLEGHPGARLLFGRRTRGS